MNELGHREGPVTQNVCVVWPRPQASLCQVLGCLGTRTVLCAPSTPPTASAGHLLRAELVQDTAVPTASHARGVWPALSSTQDAPC